MLIVWNPIALEIFQGCQDPLSPLRIRPLGLSCVDYKNVSKCGYDIWIRKVKGKYAVLSKTFTACMRRVRTNDKGSA